MATPLPKVFSGARAKVSIFNPNTGTSQVIGIFSNCSYGFSYSTNPAYILGRYTAAEIDYTSVDTVSMSCTGYRVVGGGGHKIGAMPAVNDLLTHQYITITLYDRQTGENVATVTSVRPTGYSTSVDARNTVQITVNYVGIEVSDESTNNLESVGTGALATDMPEGD